MLVLRVGDPHVQPSNIKESYSLLSFVLEIAIKYKVDQIEILGDLLHTHAQIRLEGLEFWDIWLYRLAESFKTIVLVGNHNQIGAYNSTSHSLSVFHDRLGKNPIIISNPILIGIIGYLPYIHNKETFVEKANKLVDEGAKIIVCHQTFNGAKYESGIYAPDGIDLELIKAPLIISGHIHSRQRFNKVIYPGTARWLTNADANEQKGLWLVEHDDITGEIIKEEFVDTSNVCTPIISVKWLEGEEKPNLAENAKNHIELIGSSSWIIKQKQLLKNTCAISTRIMDSKKTRWKPKKSENNLENFIIQQYNISSGLNKEKLLAYMKEELQFL